MNGLCFCLVRGTGLAALDRKIKAEQEAIVDSLRDRQIGKITEEEYIKISRQGMYNVDT